MPAGTALGRCTISCRVDADKGRRCWHTAFSLQQYHVTPEAKHCRQVAECQKTAVQAMAANDMEEMGLSSDCSGLHCFHARRGFGTRPARQPGCRMSLGVDGRQVFFQGLLFTRPPALCLLLKVPIFFRALPLSRPLLQNAASRLKPGTDGG